MPATLDPEEVLRHDVAPPVPLIRAEDDDDDEKEEEEDTNDLDEELEVVVPAVEPLEQIDDFDEDDFDDDFDDDFEEELEEEEGFGTDAADRDDDFDAD